MELRVTWQAHKQVEPFLQQVLREVLHHLHLFLLLAVEEVALTGQIILGAMAALVVVVVFILRLLVLVFQVKVIMVE